MLTVGYCGAVAGTSDQVEVHPFSRATSSPLRQQVMVLHLASSSLDSRVLSWALYDGAGQESSETGDHPEAPFGTGLEALRAGWRVFGVSQLLPAYPGTEYSTSFQKFEFFFERMVEVGQEKGES